LYRYGNTRRLVCPLRQPFHTSAAVLCSDRSVPVPGSRSRAITASPASPPLTRFVADRFAWVCALWLHLALYIVVTEDGLWRTVLPPPAAPVEVEIVARVPAAPAAETPPADISPASREDSVANAAASRPRDRAAPAGAAAWVTATRFLAADVLKDPRSAEARLALATLTGADGIEQLCALEAMEQLRKDRPGFRPTRLSPHAFRNGYRKGDTVHVTAGAVRSNRIWYEIAYRCRLGTGGDAIAGFDYALGAPIDRALWDENGLAPVH